MLRKTPAAHISAKNRCAITAYIPVDKVPRLNAIAALWGCSRSEAIVRMIEERPEDPEIIDKSKVDKV
jgi:hypothetical protein